MIGEPRSATLVACPWANLAALQPGDALRTRLLRQLDTDESKHTQLDGAIETATRAVNAAQFELAEAIEALKF